MNSRIEKVKYLFDVPDLYLKKDFDVSLRSLIVRDLLGKVSDSQILDLGCGDGRISLQYLSETNHIVLVDLSNEMLEIARKSTPEAFRRNVNYINSELHEYETKELFDVVLCIGVLAHVVSVEETITKVARFLKPGGRCIFQITDNDKMTGKFFNAFYSVRNSFVRSRGYALNKIGLSSMIAAAHLNGLNLMSTQQYLSPLPGMGKLANERLFKYETFTLENSLVSRIGSEVIMLCSKELEVSAKSVR